VEHGTATKSKEAVNDGNMICFQTDAIYAPYNQGNNTHTYRLFLSGARRTETGKLHSKLFDVLIIFRSGKSFARYM
jgi:hypothetical protein